jgi:hypothetical protein
MVVKIRLDAIGVRPCIYVAPTCNSVKYERDWCAAKTGLHSNGLFREASVEVFYLARFVRAFFFSRRFAHVARA